MGKFKTDITEIGC